MIPLGVVGEEFIPATDRGEIFIQVAYPIGTPLTTVETGIFAFEKKILGYPGHLRKHGGGRRLRRVVRRIRFASERRPGARLAQRQPQAPDVVLGDGVSKTCAEGRFPPNVIGRRRAVDRHGRRQRAAGRLPRHRRDRRRSDAVCAEGPRRAHDSVKGATSVNSSGAALTPEISVIFNREKAAGARCRRRTGGASRRRGVRRQRRDAVRNDRGPRASAGHLSAPGSDQSGSVAQRADSRLERLDRLSRRYRDV